MFKSDCSDVDSSISDPSEDNDKSKKTSDIEQQNSDSQR